jgi:cytochrome P450
MNRLGSAGSEFREDRLTTMDVSADSQSAAAQGAREAPGPRGLPWIGCLAGILRDPMAFMTRVARQYGGLARIPVRGQHFYLASDPEVIRELLITHRQRYTKNVRYRHVQALLGQGLLLAEAEAWRRQRVMTQRAYKAESIDAQVPWMAQMTGDHLARWQPCAANGEVVDVEPAFIELTQMLAGRSLLGEPFAEIAQRFCAAASAAKNAWPLPPRTLWQALRRRKSESPDPFDLAIAELDRCIFDFIEAHRADDFAGCAVLELIARGACEQGSPFSDQDLRDQIFTLFFAGHETSATALCWIHYLLSRHPGIRERMFAEVDQVLGRDVPTADTLRGLRYTEQVVQESLRLYSPIHSISRVASEEHTLGGYRIPAGATVCVSLYATHRLPRYWHEPERFDPERFTEERCAARSRFSYLPFAAGHRNCIGGVQAMVELKMIVAMLAQRYRLEIAPGQRIHPAPGTTMYPRHGMKMSVHAQTEMHERTR